MRVTMEQERKRHEAGGSRPKPQARLPAHAIEFSGVYKRFGREPVLSDLSLKVRAGEIFGLVGTNGAGKTTCMKCLLDFCDVDAGRIEIFGRPASAPESRRPLGYLPERFLPPHHLRGREFLEFMARMHGVEPGAERRRELLAALDLAPGALDKPVRACSKGMAQKLGLAACFLAGKSLLVLDEPMSGLDPKARLLVKRHLAGLRAGGATVFFSTHLLADAGELCDRMGVLHDGTMRFIGPPARLRQRFPSATLEDAWLACISHAPHERGREWAAGQGHGDGLRLVEGMARRNRNGG